jgi:periplasmic protein TonB
MVSEEPGHSTGDYFVWSSEERPVSVHLNLRGVNALDAQARATLGTMPRRGIEIGGLLLGRVKNPNPGQYIVSVEQFEPFEIEHLRGLSYILSAADRDTLSQRLRKLAVGKKGLSVVGFYRSHTRPGLYLDEYDSDLLKTYFADASSVALLVRPVHDGPSTAGFFIWEEGEIYRARTYREFPLKAELLNPQWPAERPDASAPVDSPLPAISPAIARTTSPVMPPSAALDSSAAANAGRALRNPWIAWTAAAAAILITAAALRQPGDNDRKHPHNVLSLNAEASQSGLRLTWDRTNPLIAEHGAATLSITDGDEEKLLALDATQLKTGALVYWPTSRDVNFRLQIGGFSESLRAVSPKLPETPAVETAAIHAPPPSSPIQTPEMKPLLTSIRNRTDQVPSPDPEPPQITPPKTQPAPPAETSPANVEPAGESRLKKTVAAIPRLLLGKRRDPKNDFVPAKAVRQVNPKLPGAVKLEADTRVSVRVSVDESGSVKGTDLVTRDVDARLANAAMDAARRWRFQPAREQRRPVASAVILHFNFDRGGDGS